MKLGKRKTLFVIFFIKTLCDDYLIMQILPYVSYLKHLQVINPSFVTITKPLSIDIGETFSVMCKLL